MAGGDDEGQVVFITGCSDGGIGASLALEFAQRGFRVVASSLALGSMKELSLHENIHAVVLDVRDFEAAKASVESVVADYGHIDILINNAGVQCVAPVAEVPLPALEATYRTNILGPVALIQAVVPHMASRGKGKIVNIGSVVSRAYAPWSSGYISSKAALEALTDALRLELKPFGIQVMLVLPGAIKSNIGKNGLALFNSLTLDNLKLYKSFEPTMRKRVDMSQTMRSTSTKDFAEAVVGKVVAKSPPRHFSYGSLSTIFFFLFYTPLVIRDFIFSKFFGLDKMMPVSDKKAD